METGGYLGSRYTNTRIRIFDLHIQWKQLKKDYVPGYGDTIDLVVIAGSWEKDRARELRGRYHPGLTGNSTSKSDLVPPSTLTRFYVGALGNSFQCTANVSSFGWYTTIQG